MPKGGARPGSGRKKGTKNKVPYKLAPPAAVKTIGELARAHTADALKALTTIATKGKTEAGRVAAAKALLERGYGMPKQTMDMNSNVTTILQLDLSGLNDEEICALRDLQSGILGAAARPNGADRGDGPTTH